MKKLLFFIAIIMFVIGGISLILFNETNLNLKDNSIEQNSQNEKQNIRQDNEIGITKNENKPIFLSVDNNLIDHTYISSIELCSAGNKGINVSVSPCISNTWKNPSNIINELQFSWNETGNLEWIFIYDRELPTYSIKKGNPTSHNIINNIFGEGTTSVLVDNIITITVDIPSRAFCNHFGNENNTNASIVVRVVPGNGSIVEHYCYNERIQIDENTYNFTGNDTIVISNIIDKERIVYNENFDVQFLGSNLLGHNKYYYMITDSHLISENNYYRWKFTPQLGEISGKWSILGFDSNLGLEEAILAGQYVYLDPGWDANLDTGIVTYYNFNETSGDLIDLVDGDDNGTIGDLIERPVSGISENAYNITTGVSGQTVNISNQNDLDFTDIFSVNVWVNATAQNAVNIISKRDPAMAGGGTVDYQIQRRPNFNDTHFSIRESDPTTPRSLLTPFNSHNANSSWIMITAIANGTDLVVYHNSIKMATLSYDGTIQNQASSRMFIGENARSASADQWMGIIDEIGFWNRSLTDTEIVQLYNGGEGLTYQQQIEGVLVTLNSPPNGFDSSNISIEFNATLDPTDSNITNATLYVWRNEVLYLNSFNNTVSGISSTNIIFNGTLEIGNYEWNVEGCTNSSLNSCSFAFQNFSLSIQSLTAGVIYNNQTFDTDNQTFILETTFDPNIIIEIFGSLIYDGVTYPTNSIITSGSNTNLTTIIDIPIVNAQTDKQFIWSINFINTTGVVSQLNTSTLNQTVNPSILDDCSSASIETVNYTIFREDTRAFLSSPLDISFEWFLGGGSVVKNSSFTKTTLPNHIFCINANETFYTNVKLDLEVQGYNNQLYDFLLERYTNVSTLQLLGMINDSAASDIIIKIKDTGAQPLTGWMVQIYKFYPEINEYQLVGSRITDVFGQFEESLVQKTARYRFQFFDTNRRLRQTEDASVACELTFCFIEFIIESGLDIFDIYGDIEGFSRSLNFNNATNTFVFSWSDNTGQSPELRLLVQRVGFNQTIICNETSNDLVGSLSCSVGSDSASYIAQGFRKVGEQETRVIVLTIKIGDISVTIGVEGLFWSFILLMTLLGIGSWNPVVGVGLYIAGFALLGGFGIFYMPPILFFSTLVIGVLFIWALKT